MPLVLPELDREPPVLRLCDRGEYDDRALEGGREGDDRCTLPEEPEPLEGRRTEVAPPEEPEPPLPGDDRRTPVGACFEDAPAPPPTEERTPSTILLTSGVSVCRLTGMRTIGPVPRPVGELNRGDGGTTLKPVRDSGAEEGPRTSLRNPPPTLPRGDAGGEAGPEARGREPPYSDRPLEATEPGEENWSLALGVVDPPTRPRW